MMMFLSVTIGVVIGLAWFTAGVIGPIVSCAKRGKFDRVDFIYIPLAGIFGFFFLFSFLAAYTKELAKK